MEATAVEATAVKATTTTVAAAATRLAGATKEGARFDIRWLGAIHAALFLGARGLGNTAAGLPTAALPDEILLPGDGRVRALFVLGGNPMMAFPDQRRTESALRALDLLVTFDPELSATAELAHYVIAPTLSLEVPGMTNYVDMLPAYAPGYGLPKPWAQYTPAIVDPPEGSDVIPEWEFFYGLAQRMGLALEVRPVDFNGPTGATLPIPMDVKPTAD